jgi:hypothetical protein
VLSLLAAVPAQNLRDDLGPDGALAHVTVCREHVGPVRLWLQGAAIPGEGVDTYGTDFLLRTWGQVELLAEDMPIFRLTAVS